MNLSLIPHPATPPNDPEFKIWANVDHAAGLGAMATLNIWFGVSSPVERFVIPESERPGRRHELWKTTCFEAFLRRTGESGYREWNFAPSGDWAAYDFTGYRDGMSEAEIGQPPYIRMEDNLTWWTVGATVSVPAGGEWEVNLTAVLEEKDGTKSYWALAHAADTPDFHHPDCFAARLA